MSKISELSDGGSLVSSDYLIAVRSGGNVKVRMDQINVDQIDLGDNEFIRLGNSQDLTIVHAATQSIINQAGIGDLLIQKAGSTKLTVNSSGIDVTGTVTADGLTVSASAATANITSTSGGATLNLTHPTATDGYSIRQGNANADDFRIFEGSKIKLNITTGGDISFYEDTGTTAKLFWDASAESLGIGTSSPFFTAAGRSSLSVNGTSSSILAFGKGGSSENYILADAGGLTIANTSATLPTAFFNNGSTRMTISSAGSVGIGVTPKTTNATVTGSLNVNQAGLLVRNSNQAYFASNIYWDASDQLKSYAAGYGLASLFVPSDGSHRFFNTTAAATGADQNLTLNETMRITSNGWVNPNANTTSNPADSQGLHFGWNLSNGGGESLIVFNKGAGATGGLVFSDNSANGTPVERMRLDGATGNLLVGLSSGQDALIHAQAPKTTYTDYATVFAGGTDSHNGDHAISLMTSGNSLAGIIGSNLSIDGTAFSQPETARSSGYISFSNNTTAGKTSTITFGGLIKGTATALPKMTLDGDGTLLVGESADFLATSTTATGLSVTQDGRFTLSRSGIPMNVSRLGSDGSLIDFWRQGATVGSIGTSAGHLYVGNGDTNLIFNDTANSIYPWDSSANDVQDATVDLGANTARFKDLYLSGGAFLGGTAAANKLDDYEEGLWTPQVNFGGSDNGVTYGTRIGRYTKIGRMVYLSFNILLSSKGSQTGQVTISGAPFGNYAGSQNNASPIICEGNGSSFPDAFGMMWNDNQIYVRYQGATSKLPLYESNFTNSTQIFGMMQYET